MDAGKSRSRHPLRAVSIAYGISLLHVNAAKRNTILFGIAALLTLFLLENGCVKEFPGQLLPNVPPRTYFWLYPSDTVIATGISKQELRWWSEDQDGYVVGYLLAVVPILAAMPVPDTLSYTYVTTSDSVISFPLRQARQTFLVAVHAVDNTFAFPLPVGSIVRLDSVPYWDRNHDGQFDTTDIRLDDLLNAMDLNGAIQRFPTRNTPPTIHYVADALNDTAYAQPPLVSLTVAAFSWIGHDFDGDETIASYRLSLNDSTFASPLIVSSNVTTITLSVPRGRSDSAISSTADADVLFGTSPALRKLGTLPGLKMDAMNAFYVQTVDVAGDRSAFLSFPSKGRSWYVQKPRGKMLLVIDYVLGGDSAAVRRFYTDSVFARIGISYDMINLRSGAMVPAAQHLNPAFIKTLKLYSCVFWYTDAAPSLALARTSLFDYWNSPDGGHLIYSAKYADPYAIPDAGHAYRDIAPLDSLGSAPLAVTRFDPDSALALSATYPTMKFKSRTAGAGICIFPFYKNAAAEYIYSFPATSSYPMTYVGVIDGTKRMIFFNIPLDKMGAMIPDGQGVVGFFQKALNEFGLQ
jgi:hypothetical protein